MSTLPPPAWHVDPLDPRQLRYWDGHAWTNHVHVVPTVAPPPAVRPASTDPLDLPNWFEASRVAMLTVVRSLWLPLLVTWGAFSIAGGIWIWQLRTSRPGERFFDLFAYDAATIDGNQFEAAARDLFAEAVPGMIAFGVVAVLLMSWSSAVSTVAADEHLAVGSIDRRRALAVGTVRAPMVLAAQIVSVVPAFSVAALVVSVAIGLFGVEVALGAVWLSIAIPAGLAAIIWLSGKLSLAVAAAGTGRHGLGLAASWELTKRRWGTVILRLVIVRLVLQSASGITASLAQLGAIGGAYVAITAAMFAGLTFGAVSTFGKVPAHVALIRALEQHRTSPTASTG